VLLKILFKNGEKLHLEVDSFTCKLEKRTGKITGVVWGNAEGKNELLGIDPEQIVYVIKLDGAAKIGRNNHD